MRGAGIGLGMVASVTLFAALAIASLLLFMQNSSLESRVSALNQSIAELSGENAASAAQNTHLSQLLSSTQAQLQTSDAAGAALEARVAFLNSTLAQRDGEVLSLGIELQRERERTGQLAQDYQALQQDINSSMAWFSQNAIFPENYSWSSSILKKRLEGDCVENGQFSLACSLYLLENAAFSIRYRTDLQSNGKADHLQSLKETIDTGRGDCEDYSLLLKSLLNMLKKDMPSLQLQAWQDGGGSTYRVYPLSSKSEPDDKYWYYENTRGVMIGTLSGSFFYVVCYDVSSVAGHCVVAVSQNEILSSGEVPLLEGATLFEPQNGAHLGKVGSELSVCGSSQCGRVPGQIYQVISDYDLYRHDGSGWVGYADYAQAAGAAAD